MREQTCNEHQENIRKKENRRDEREKLEREEKKLSNKDQRKEEIISDCLVSWGWGGGEAIGSDPWRVGGGRGGYCWYMYME